MSQKPLKNKNITLGYVLIAANNAFFWYAPWLLFIYKYLDIKEATILQVLSVTTRAIAEIPTGALADLLGKKKTLSIAFLLTAVGESTMAFSTSFGGFVLAFMVLSLDYSFYSGTIDAFMYDTLVEAEEEDKYPRVLGRSHAVMDTSTAIATLIGAVLFKYWVGLPALVTGLFKLLGFGLTFLLKEPVVDTFAFSLKNFVKQTGLGLKHLFDQKMLVWTIFLMLLGSFGTVAYEILDDVAVVDWGYNATGISVLYTSVILISVPSGLLYEKLSRKFKPFYLASAGLLALAALYLFSPWINVYIWTFLFLMYVVVSVLKRSAVTEMINQNSPSNIRATTLSTYELLIRLPFIVFGAGIGAIMQGYGVKTFSTIFAGSLLTLFLVYLVLMPLLKPKKLTVSTIG